MPPIKPDLLDTVIYLYPSRACAEDGVRYGGSGFLVLVPSQQHRTLGYLYALTNTHVAEHAPVIRLNTTKGDSAVHEIDPGNWEPHPQGDDISAVHIGGIDPARFKFSAVPTGRFINDKVIEKYEIVPGDDTFMIGRFIAHDGKQRNLPSVRFGNISMMPGAPVRLRGRDQECFIVESRSLSGYSGSPVFVYTELDYYRPSIPKGTVTLGVTGGPWLLGIDCGHGPIYKPVLYSDKRTPIAERHYVELNSGMMNVIPAWRILDLLNIDRFVQTRRACDVRISEQKENETASILDGELYN